MDTGIGKWENVSFSPIRRNNTQASVLWHSTTLGVAVVIFFMIQKERLSGHLRKKKKRPDSQFSQRYRIKNLHLQLWGRQRVNCSIRVGNEILSQVEEFKYHGALFTHKWGQHGCVRGLSDERAEPKGKALNLVLNLRDAHPPKREVFRTCSNLVTADLETEGDRCPYSACGNLDCCTLPSTFLTSYLICKRTSN